MLQRIRRLLRHAQCFRDVAGVDPALGQPRRRERLDRQLTRDPLDASVRIARHQHVAQRGRAASPPVEHFNVRRPTFALHHRGRAVVDVALPVEATRERLEALGEAALRAGDRELVGLREVEHDVGDRPALAPRRPMPACVVERIEQRGELRVLLAQRGEDRLHQHLRVGRAHATEARHRARLLRARDLLVRRPDPPASNAATAPPAMRNSTTAITISWLRLGNDWRSLRPRPGTGAGPGGGPGGRPGGGPDGGPEGGPVGVLSGFPLRPGGSPAALRDGSERARTRSNRGNLTTGPAPAESVASARERTTDRHHRRRSGRHLHGHQAARGGHRLVHDLRAGPRRRRHVVPQHVSGLRVRRRSRPSTPSRSRSSATGRGPTARSPRSASTWSTASRSTGSPRTSASARASPPPVGRRACDVWRSPPRHG